MSSYVYECETCGEQQSYYRAMAHRGRGVKCRCGAVATLCTTLKDGAPVPASDVLSLRLATSDDLPAVNALIERAVDTWALSERVKRLAKPTYRYDGIDLRFEELLIAASATVPLGVAAWSGTEPDTSLVRTALLHGLFVEPAHHGERIGAALFRLVRQRAAQAGFQSLVARVQRDAEGFFDRQGMTLWGSPTGAVYPHRYRMDLPGSPGVPGPLSALPSAPLALPGST